MNTFKTFLSHANNRILHTVFLTFLLIQFSCVNDISEKNENIDSGEKPILINTKINKITTRVSDNRFDAEDKIGLFVCVDDKKLEEARYIDNECFIFKDNKFSSENGVYYPEIDCTCNFIAYYPYKVDAAKTKSSKIEVGVANDQSALVNFSDYDFMTARAQTSSDRETPVDLSFKHKLYQLNIQIKIVSGFEPELLATSNPSIYIKNVYSKAYYDFTNDNFTDQNTLTNIIPFGEWKVKDGLLVGKTALIIPQPLKADHVFVALKIQDKVYDCRLTAETNLGSGIAETLTLELCNSADAITPTFETNIDGWTPENKNLSTEYRKASIRVSELKFTSSGILKVMNQNVQVAEICEEYINTEDLISSSTVVIYPYINGKADLKNGIVLSTTNASDKNIYGAKICWNPDNTFTYTTGSNNAIESVFIDNNGKILTVRNNNVIQLEVVPYLFEDIRGNTSISYPVAKIATQYWVYRNTKALKYTDGTDVDHIRLNESGSGLITEISAEKGQCFSYKDSYYFYNKKAILSGKLAPTGWRIASRADFETLNTYLSHDTSLLRKGKTWSNANAGQLTKFNAVAAGYYSGKYINEKKADYWTYDTNNGLGRVTIYDNNNTMGFDNSIDGVALTARYIRE